MKVNGVEVIEIVKTKIPEDKVFKVIYKDKKILKKTIKAEFRMVNKHRKIWAYIVKDENFMDLQEDYINIFSKIHEKIYEYLIRHHGYIISPLCLAIKKSSVLQDLEKMKKQVQTDSSGWYFLLE
ncbi:hypothetical protein [Ureibacillus thermophilus]|uniref:Uncharacterized protein n=1 Tax=Ureibacillus thermophilus TaxID=367743 RepID=A0A4V1A2X7_9BACL|nr:hypothetical protein [Ureibacillus thermophilus]QBK25290.1 hypothetical protein DKZ56_05105 [Ureibacillus thermophilus]